MNEFSETIDTLNASGHWLSTKIDEFKKTVKPTGLSEEDIKKLQELRGRGKAWIRDFQKLGIEEMLNGEEPI